MSDNHYDKLFKIVVIGESSVGKTALINKFVNGDKPFKEDHVTTIGVDFNAKIFKVDDTICKLHLWDTAGLERFRIITKQYYRGANGIVFVYDLTNEKSFEQLNYWFNDVFKVMPYDTPKIIVANKCDCESSLGSSLVKRGLAFAVMNGVAFIVTSAKDGHNVSMVFVEMVKQMIDHREKNFCSMVMSEVVSGVIDDENKDDIKCGKCVI